MYFKVALDSEIKEWVEMQVELRNKLLSACNSFGVEEIASTDSINFVLIYEVENLVRISRVMGLELEIEDIDDDAIFEARGKVTISNLEFFSYLRKGDKEKWVKH